MRSQFNVFYKTIQIKTNDANQPNKIELNKFCRLAVNLLTRNRLKFKCKCIESAVTRSFEGFIWFFFFFLSKSNRNSRRFREWSFSCHNYCSFLDKRYTIELASISDDSDDVEALIGHKIRSIFNKKTNYDWDCLCENSIRRNGTNERQREAKEWTKTGYIEWFEILRCRQRQLSIMSM